jgi:hypothetical protein
MTPIAFFDFGRRAWQFDVPRRQTSKAETQKYLTGFGWLRQGQSKYHNGQDFRALKR